MERFLMKRRALLRSSVAFITGVACASGAHAAVEPTGPQPTLKKQPLVIVTGGGKRHDFQVEVATTPEQQITGLMFRKSVPADGGMLFVWGRPTDSKMWMRNTLVSLDMVFIDENGRISHIAEDTVPESLAVIDGGPGVVATLELRGGATAKLGIVVGDKVLCQALGTKP
ncbi:MAG: DUF192 domain-containing protein [Acetobacteraceae bacterium]